MSTFKVGYLDGKLIIKSKTSTLMKELKRKDTEEYVSYLCRNLGKLNSLVNTKKGFTGEWSKYVKYDTSMYLSLERDQRGRLLDNEFILRSGVQSIIIDCENEDDFKDTIFDLSEALDIFKYEQFERRVSLT